MMTAFHCDAGRALLSLSEADKARLNIMFLAKHASAGGLPSPVDGNHAVYHHEFLQTLRAIGLNVVPADTYEALERAEAFDFVIPLLNRGGFLNSELLAPVMLTRVGTPFLGATPIVRGLADDKHLAKVVACHCGVPTMDWRIWRRGGRMPTDPIGADQLVVKPNASSASWGLAIMSDWASALAHARTIHDEGHDALIERWMPRHDIAVPVIGGAEGQPLLMPPMLFRPGENGAPRSYEEKRALIPTEVEDPLEPIGEGLLRTRLFDQVEAMLPEYWPFDYGRFEFRYDPADGSLAFMEVNLSCNLWSRKSISRSAQTIGISHTALVETIVAHSMARQGVIDMAACTPLAA